MELDSSPKLTIQEHPDSSPRTKIKIRCIIYFIIIVVGTTSSFALWKSHLRNPYIKIQVACSKTSDHHLCFESISFLYKNSSTPSIKTITISEILTLSLQVEFNKLNDEIVPAISSTIASETNPGTIRALTKCNNLIKDSLISINASSKTMAAVVDPDTTFFRDTNLSRYIEGKIRDAANAIEGCRSELYFSRPRNGAVLEMKMKEAGLNLDNSLRIWYYRDEIHGELNPSIVSLVEFVKFYFHPQSMLAYSPYVFLVLLLILFIKSK